MKDIENRNDIELLVNEFYRRIREDDLVGFIFNDIVKIDWDKHLPVMYDFWDNVILFSGTYTGNPMDLHKNLHNITPVDSRHFSRWVQLFVDTVDSLYKGEKAALAKQKAKSISSIIQEKIL
ncbi:MAG: group III truncated hemoglobin [Bacteroidota bacterium]